MSGKLIDVSVPVSATTVVWPSAPSPVFERRLSIERGDAVNDSNVFMNAHTGTHIDAPLHHFDGAMAADQVAFEALLGDAWVISLPDVATITADRLAAVWPEAPVKRVLFKTRNSALWSAHGPGFFEDFCALTPDGAEWLAARSVLLVGIDYLSVQRFADSNAVHRTLLGAGIVLLEGLDLSAAPPGRYELLCLPLRLVGLEASPARVILRTIA
jgi:arylformamidase